MIADYTDFSLITNKLPVSAFCGGIEYIFDTRTVKALQALYWLSLDEVPAVTRLDTALSLIVRNYDDITAESVSELEKDVLDYLSGYPKAVNGRQGKKEVLSYIQDHDLIVSSFREAYGFTLEEIRNMHWWVFLAYLNGLPSDTRLANVIQIRLTEITSKDSPETRRAKIQAKQAVALRPRQIHGDGEDGMDIISAALEQQGD